ncbi:MAG: DegV family EDD domain-containing protein [Clostridiales bacterium]|nr:DegV family EDD domain-containing protein [Clostridiales bacterium]MBR5417779.1 DegV family EDD domain-containing protein [Clostridiales bacterium]
MKGIIDYIFRPSTHDKEVEKSIYKGMARTTHAMVMFTMAFVFAFFIWTLIEPSAFDNSLPLHRILYLTFLMTGCFWIVLMRYASKDFDTRYKVMKFLSPFLGVMMYALCIALSFVNVHFNDYIDTTIFLAVSLMVPICIYLNPLEYICLVTVSDVGMGLLMYVAYSQKGITSQESFVNFLVFLVFQLVMGIVMLYTKYCLQKEIVTANRQHQEIEMLNKAQNSFFSNMSHEIRTPINTIIGLNEMILREDVSEEVLEDAANIKSAGKLLLNLINDILDMSKIQSGRMQLLSAPYQTGEMLSDLVGMMWIRAKEKKLEFHVDVSPDIPHELIGDDVRIKQILINVLNNAIKYTKEGSVSLNVQCEMVNENTCNMIYNVSDTGVGIKPEDIPYLFSAFKRVDEDTNKHIEGTGLGLSIVKQLVDLMGGKVTVNSVYTKGSTFIIEIPQVCENKSKMGQYNFEKTGSLSHKEDYVPKFEAPEARILVVDDNEANLMVVSKLLRETKVRVDTALSGADALRKTLNIHYDAIFMDHLMPEMDGIECRRRIIDQTGGRCRETSIVILTANADEENRALYQKENFDGYLVKPVSGAELENELYRILPRDIVHITGNRTEIAEESISWMNNSKKRKRVVITTESVADLPQELIDRYDIAVLPHKVQTKEGIFKDGNEIDTKGVLKYMEDPDREVTTMVPETKEVEEFFAKQLSVANNIIHISISSKVQHSGFAVALEASKSFDSVYVIDTGHLSSGQGLLAIEACRMAEDGKSPDEIIARVERLKKKVHTSFIVDNLDFLARAKQVGKGVANLVNSLMGRPVLVLKKGTMGLGKLFFGSRKRAWKKYIGKCLASERPIDTKILFVTYVGLSKRDLDWIREQIEKRIKFDEVYFQQASPAIAVNCGPGTFGLLLREKDKDDQRGA